MFLLNIEDCYKVAPSKSPPVGKTSKPSLPGRVWVGAGFTNCSKLCKFNKPIIKPIINETHPFIAAFAAGLLCHRSK